MSAPALTQPSELGILAAEAIRDVTARATAGAAISSYAEGESPLAWSVLADGGWDLVGVVDEDDPSESATIRDLAEIARAWGEACLQLPLLPTIIAKRHSSAARDWDGPVTFAVPSATLPGGAYVPYGQVEGVALAAGLGAGTDEIVAVPTGTADDFDLLLRGSEVASPTDFSPLAARELSIMLAAEASGAAARLLNDGIAYVKERRQFGKPVGSFQAVKHHLANALINAELAETGVIWSSLHDDDSFRGALFAIDRSIAVGELVLQVHGGIGFTWDMGLHFYLRRMVTARDLVTGLQGSCA